MTDCEKGPPSHQHMPDHPTRVKQLQAHLELPISLRIASLIDAPAVLPVDHREPVAELNHPALPSLRISHYLSASFEDETRPLLEIKFPRSDVGSLHRQIHPFRIGISAPS